MPNTQQQISTTTDDMTACVTVLVFRDQAVLYRATVSPE